MLLKQHTGKRGLRQGKIEAGELWRAEKLRSAVALLLLPPAIASDLSRNPACTPCVHSSIKCSREEHSRKPIGLYVAERWEVALRKQGLTDHHTLNTNPLTNTLNMWLACAVHPQYVLLYPDAVSVKIADVLRKITFPKEKIQKTHYWVLIGKC
jgi:hypothetical protein